MFINSIQENTPCSLKILKNNYHRNGDHMEGYQQGGEGKNGGKGTGNKEHKW